MAEVNVAWEIETNYLLSYINTRKLSGKMVQNRNLETLIFQSHLRVMLMSPAGPRDPRPGLQFVFLCNILGQVMTRGSLQYAAVPTVASAQSSDTACSTGLQSAEHDERIKPNTSEPSGSIKHIPSSFCHPRSAVESKNKFGRVKMIIGVFGSSQPVKRPSPSPQNSRYLANCANITDPLFSIPFEFWSLKTGTGNHISTFLVWREIIHLLSYFGDLGNVLK